MTEPRDGSAQDRALWQRWSSMERVPSGEGPGGDAAPDAMSLAEFAENRLSGPQEAAIEAFLASHPAIAQDVAAAGRAVEVSPRAGDVALAAAIARAAALVPAQGARGRMGGGGNVVAFDAARPAGSAWP